jgi:hypothetical protein
LIGSLKPSLQAKDKVDEGVRPHFHIAWVPKYRKRILTAAVVVRVRELRQHELHMISGVCGPPCMFLSYRAAAMRFKPSRMHAAGTPAGCVL